MYYTPDPQFSAFYRGRKHCKCQGWMDTSKKLFSIYNREEKNVNSPQQPTQDLQNLKPDKILVYLNSEVSV